MVTVVTTVVTMVTIVTVVSIDTRRVPGAVRVHHEAPGVRLLLANTRGHHQQLRRRHRQVHPVHPAERDVPAAQPGAGA